MKGKFTKKGGITLLIMERCILVWTGGECVLLPNPESAFATAAEACGEIDFSPNHSPNQIKAKIEAVLVNNQVNTE